MKKKIIRRPRKVCTVNRFGKKKCFTIQARRRLNPNKYNFPKVLDYKELIQNKLQNINFERFTDSQLFEILGKLQDFNTYLNELIK